LYRAKNKRRLVKQTLQLKRGGFRKGKLEQHFDRNLTRDNTKSQHSQQPTRREGYTPNWRILIMITTRGGYGGGGHKIVRGTGPPVPYNFRWVQGHLKNTDLGMEGGKGVCRFRPIKTGFTSPVSEGSGWAPH